MSVSTEPVDLGELVGSLVLRDDQASGFPELQACKLGIGAGDGAGERAAACGH